MRTPVYLFFFDVGLLKLVRACGTCPVSLFFSLRLDVGYRYKAKKVGCAGVLRCESLVLYRIMYGNRVMKVQQRYNFVVGSDNNTEIIS